MPNARSILFFLLLKHSSHHENRSRCRRSRVLSDVGSAAGTDIKSHCEYPFPLPIWATRLNTSGIEASTLLCTTRTASTILHLCRFTYFTSRFHQEKGELEQLKIAQRGQKEIRCPTTLTTVAGREAMMSRLMTTRNQFPLAERFMQAGST